MVTIASSRASLPPSGPQIPLVPSSSATSSSQSASQTAPQTQFKDVYQNVPAGEQNEQDSGSRQKSASPKNNSTKKTDSDGNQKTAPVISNLAIPQVTVKSLFGAPSLGLQAPVREDGSTSGSETGSGDGSRQGGEAVQTAGGNLADQVAAPGLFTRTISASTDLPLPRINTLAFSVRLHNPDVVQTQTKTIAPRVQTPGQLIPAAAREIKPPAAQAPLVPNLHADDATEPAKRILASEPGVAQPHALSTVAAATESLPASLAYESTAPVHDTAVAAIRDVAAVGPDAPKAPATSEILLHLASHDQAAAAVRVIDRAGTVSVAVHAPDPNLRDSLRSNLGDLTTQLNTQGFRTEVVKPTTVAAHADNAQDSRHDGQRSLSQQQQTAAGDRNASRQRRTNADRWEDELERDTTGDASPDGGRK